MNETLRLAQLFMGLHEVAGDEAHPQIMAMLQLDGNAWTEANGDETPWCSAFVNYVMWLRGLPRSKSLMARSWLAVGEPTIQFSAIARAQPGDVVILKRGGGDQPGAEVLDAPGHVGFFYEWDDRDRFSILGGNQGNSVSISWYDEDRVLGVRRIG